MSTTPKHCTNELIPRISRTYYSYKRERETYLKIVETSHTQTNTTSDNADANYDEYEHSHLHRDLIVDEEQTCMKEHTGYKITSIDIDRQWTTTVKNHIKNCPKGVLVVVDSIKNGYELIDIYEC